MDKKIKFHKVLGMEHTFKMKNYSNSEAHFKMTIFLPVLGFGFLAAMFKTIFTKINPGFNEVCNVENI